MNYRVSAKLQTGKWFGFGNIKENKFGNLQLSFKNTQQFKDFVNEGGEWLNFSLFADDEEKKAMQKATPAPAEYKSTDEIPF